MNSNASRNIPFGQPLPRPFHETAFCHESRFSYRQAHNYGIPINEAGMNGSGKGERLLRHNLHLQSTNDTSQFCFLICT